MAEPLRRLNIPFEQWAMTKYHEAMEMINPCDSQGKLDPQRLNEVLSRFAQHFGWAITLSEIEQNKANQLKQEHDNWYKGQYNEAYRRLREESIGNKLPGQTSIDARVVDVCKEELQIRQEQLRLQEGRVEVMKGLVKVMDRQASILQTISSNMRSELFFAGGITMGQTTTPTQRMEKVKTVMREAMTRRPEEPEGS